MNDKVEIKGKTVKDAVAEALLRLGARRDEVNVTVLEEPKSGFLGLLGGRPARVQVEIKRGGGSRGGNRSRGNSRGHSLSEDSGNRRRRKNNNNRGRGQSARGEGDSGRKRQESGRNEGQGGNRSRGQQNESRNRRDNQRQDNQRQDNTRREGAGSEKTPKDDSRQGGSRRDNRRSGGRGDRNRRPRPAARTEASAPTQESPKPVAAKEERREPTGGRGTNERNQRNRRGNRNRRPRSQDRDLPRASEQQAATPSTPVAAPPREQPRSQPAARKITNDQETTRMEKKSAARPNPAVASVIKEGLKGASFAKAIREVPEEEVKTTLEKLAGGMLLRAGFPCRCQVHEGDYLQVRVVTDDASAGMLIGRHGATVDSVEHLVERMISTARGDRVKMNLDINNYRRRRQDTLADRVDDAVNRVQETGREYHLEPMNARERRLVHLQVEAIEGLTTVTVAEDRSKHVVISREDAVGQAEPVEGPDQPEA